MAVEIESAMLKGIPELEAVARGDDVLERGERGAPVRAVQRGLLELGYGLRGGADGVFGSATDSTLAEFRELYGMLGQAMVDAATLAALDLSLMRKGRAESYELTNGRFKRDVGLEKVLALSAPLPRSGESVKLIQQALSDLAFSLPRGGVDGKLGGETREALRRFQRWQHIRPGGELTPLTLMALDQAAPPQLEMAERFPEYDRLIRDKWLTVTLGIGYDEGGADLDKIAELESAFRHEGFAKSRSLGSEELAVYTKKLDHPERSGEMRVRVINRHTPSPEAAFAEGLVHDAVTIYSGHARYGTGPDFDEKESAEENFVIGLGAPGHRNRTLEPGYNAHMNQILEGQPNDLLTHRFDPERYQLWVFAGCTTRNYLDELRALVKGKDSRNLDLVVSTRPLYWSDGDFYVMELLGGLIKGLSINAIHKTLCARASETDTRLKNEGAELDAFLFDGFGDNEPLK
jgi:peptidoglycan hydrolase-like protein with peptidoglycan-binding domain